MVDRKYPYRRKQYLIDRKIQLKYAILVISLLLIYTIFVLTAIFGHSVAILFTSAPPELKESAAESLLLLHYNSWPYIVLLVLLFGILSIFVTHKMAGPIFVFKRTAQQIAEGDLTKRIKLRQNDDLHDLAACFNAMTIELECQTQALYKMHEGLSDEISELEDCLKSGQCPTDIINRHFGQLHKTREEISAIIANYKFTKDSA